MKSDKLYFFSHGGRVRSFSNLNSLNVVLFLKFVFLLDENKKKKYKNTKKKEIKN